MTSRARFAFLLSGLFTACGPGATLHDPPVLDPATVPLSGDPVEVLPPELPGFDAREDLRHFGDVLRDSALLRSDPRLGSYFEDPGLDAVTREFGPAVISMQNLPYRSPLGQAARKPWSSWWYPKKEDYLFKDLEGRASALSKYDAFRRRRTDSARRASLASAADYARRNYRADALAWEGLCDAWSLASIDAPEPARAARVSVGDTRYAFGVGELKGLLLMTYEAVEEKDLLYYGQKFTGDHRGWIHPDVFPEQFHRFVQAQIFERREAFVMDHDPGPEVWSVPVFKANYTLEAVANDPNAVFVRTWLFSAAPTQSQDRDLVGTTEVIREYAYVLRGTRDANGNLVINSGYWTQSPSGVDSRRNHPDFFVRIPSGRPLPRRSWNPGIDNATVDEILKESR